MSRAGKDKQDRQAKIVQKSLHCTPLSMLDLPEKKIIATVPLCKGTTRQSLIDEASNISQAITNGAD